MTEQEVAKVLYVLNINYKSDSKTNAVDMEKRLKLWAAEFVDEDAELVNRAVQVHISQSEFYPTIASIKKILASIKEERYYLARHGNGKVIRIGNKTHIAYNITDVNLTPEESAYLDNLWNELKEADAF